MVKYLLQRNKMKIKNIKVRFIFEKDVIEKTNKHVIWRNGKSTFSIYKDSRKFINVTGLKSLQEIKIGTKWVGKRVGELKSGEKSGKSQSGAFGTSPGGQNRIFFVF